MWLFYNSLGLTDGRSNIHSTAFWLFFFFFTGLIEIGDIIIKINDFKINKEGDLIQALETFKPGDVIKVTINRPDLESPNSTALKLNQKVLSIELKASGSNATPQYILIPPPHD